MCLLWRDYSRGQHGMPYVLREGGARMIGFIIGFFIGGMFGFTVAAILVMAREDDDDGKIKFENK